MMKKSKVKGFTLIEMIIVIALFSVIMYSVVRLLDPVSKFFVRSTNYEESTACIDNIKRAIEGNLKYADRVRLYYNYCPEDTDLDGSIYNIDVSVQKFYDEFFKDRALTDTNGKIYVMFFDNRDYQTRTGDPLPTLTRLADYNVKECNRGKIDMYEFEFDADDSTGKYISGFTIHPWYVNQNLYGNFDFTFTLSDTSTTTISPENFEIGIHAEQITWDDTVNGAIKRTSAGHTNASFAMKNVLQLKNGSSSIGNDIVTRLKTGKNKADVVADDFIPSRVPRWKAFSNPTPVSAGESPSFYFVFTMPETTFNGDTNEYLKIPKP